MFIFADEYKPSNSSGAYRYQGRASLNRHDLIRQQATNESSRLPRPRKLSSKSCWLIGASRSINSTCPRASPTLCTNVGFMSVPSPTMRRPLSHSSSRPASLNCSLPYPHNRRLRPPRSDQARSRFLQVHKNARWVRKVPPLFLFCTK